MISTPHNPSPSIDMQAVADAEPSRGPSHLLGDHSPGSYRRWVLDGGMRRAQEEDLAREDDRRRRALHDLWRRAHGANSWPPDVVHLTVYPVSRHRKILAEMESAYAELCDYLAGQVQR